MVQITSQMTVPAASNAAPGDITPGTFERWPLANQIAYIKANGTGDPKSVILGSAPGATGIAVLTAPYGQVQGVTVFTRTANQSDPNGDRNAVSDRDLFGDYEGVEPYHPALDLPDNFSTSPGSLTPQDFSAWPSVIQRAYLHKNGNQTTGRQFELTIGPSGNQCTAYLSAFRSPSAVRIIEQLDKTSIARMSSQEQSALLRMDAFTSSAMGKLGLSNKTDEIFNFIDNALKDPARFTDNRKLPDDQYSKFELELSFLKESIRENGIFSEAAVRDKVAQIKDRYKRLTFFYARDKEGNVVTADDNASLSRSVQQFMIQEDSILTVAQERARLSRDNSQDRRNLDAPGLIALFQMLAYKSSESNLYANAEEMNSLNELIKYVGVVQTGLNNIAKKADAKAPDTKYDYQKQNNEDSAFLALLNKAVWLFAGTRRHPLEDVYNINRNGNESFGEKTAAQWAVLGQKISDYINGLNQQSQIMMNKYNSDTKAKDRFYDLANTALSKMNDTIQKISNAS